MKKHKNVDTKINSIIDNYVNGNRKDAKMAIIKLDAYETAILISRWQPYHVAINKIQLAFEDLT